MFEPVILLFTRRCWRRVRHLAFRECRTRSRFSWTRNRTVLVLFHMLIYSLFSVVKLLYIKRVLEVSQKPHPLYLTEEQTWKRGIR